MAVVRFQVPGAFPSNGHGASDVYEVYGNFFHQNPVEALLQATGMEVRYEEEWDGHKW